MKHIDDLFKEELGGYAEMPPPPAWSALEKRLEEDKRRRAFPYRWFWVVSLIAFVAISGYGVANKLASERELVSAALSLPRPAAEHAVAPSVTSQNKTVRKEVKATTTIASTNRSNAATHKKHRKHTSSIVRTTTITKHTIATGKEEEKTAAAKTSSAPSAYPSEDDIYEGAVASTAPIAYESTSQPGYTVNKRKKHNLVVADMSPVAEEQPRYATATETPKIINEPATTNANINVVKTVTLKHKASHSAIRTNATNATVALAYKAQPKTAALKPAPKTMTLAAAPAKQATTAHHINTTTINTSAANSTTAARAVATTAHNEQHRASVSKSISIAAVPATKSAYTAATKTQKEQPVASIKNASTIKVAAAPATIAKSHVATASASNVAPVKPLANKTAGTSQTPAHPAETATNVEKTTPVQKTTTETQIAKTQHRTMPIASVTTSSTAATKRSLPIAATTTAGKKVAHTAQAAKTAEAKQQPEAAKTTPVTIDTKSLPVAAATPVSKKTAHVPHSAKEIAAKNKPATSVDATSSTTIAEATKPDNSSKAAKEVTPAGTTAHISKKQHKEKAAATTAAKQLPTTPATSALAIATPALPTKASKTAKHKQGNAQPAPIVPQAKATAKAARQPAYHFTPSIEDDMPAPVIDNLRTESVVAAAGNAEIPMGTFKATKPAETTESLAAKEEAKSQAPTDSTISGKHRHYEAGIKAGFEGSIMSGAANKFVISPYLDYKISSKFSLLLQPAIKTSSLATHGLAGSQTFYNAHPGDSSMISSAPTLMYNNATHTWDTLFTVRKYVYNQTHDSVVKSYNVGGTYFEFELPILLKYKINEKLSVYGGVNIDYSRMIRINEKTFNSGPIALADTQAVVSPKGQYVTPPSISTAFTYSGQPLSSYSGPLYPASSEGLIRLGYMLGFSYEFKKRWLVDALVQQCFAKPNEQGGYNTNTALSVPYMRLTLGYRLK